MHPDQLKTGMKVLIKKIDVTHKRHDSNATMRSMVGGRYTISEVCQTHKIDHQIAIRIKSPGLRSYLWAPEDLKLPILSKNIKGGKFDPSNLIY